MRNEQAGSCLRRHLPGSAAGMPRTRLLTPTLRRPTAPVTISRPRRVRCQDCPDVWLLVRPDQQTSRVLTDHWLERHDDR